MDSTRFEALSQSSSGASSSQDSATPSPGGSRAFNLHWQTRSGLCSLLALSLFLASTFYFGWLQAPNPHSPQLVRPFFSTTGWFWYPREQNPGRRLPLIPNVDLHGIFVLPDSNKQIWVVGDAGTIVHSPDGGRSWQVQANIKWPSWIELDNSRTSKTPAIEVGPAAPAAEPLGKEKGVVFPQSPTLTAQNSPIQSSPNKSPVQNSPREFNFGDSPRIFLPDAPTLRSVCFVSKTTGWVVGDHGVILSTIDSGNSWRPQEAVDWSFTNVDQSFPDPPPAPAADPAPTPAPAAAAQLPPRAAELERLAHTPLAAILAQPRIVQRQLPELLRVRFVSPEKGFIVGSDGTVKQTNDAGVTWSSCPSRNRETRYTDCAFSEDGRLGCFVADRSLLIYRESPGGGANTWEVAAPESSVGISSLEDARVAFLSGSKFLVMFPFDTFRIYDLSTTPKVDPPVDAEDPSVRIAMGVATKDRTDLIDQFGAVLQSRDATANWRRVATGMVQPLIDVCGTPAETWTCGTHGTVAVSSGGEWRAVTQNALQLSELEISSDGKECWVGVGQLLRTTNVGTDWERVALRSDSTADLIAFRRGGKPSQGWCIGSVVDTNPLHGSTAQLFQSNDSGENWRVAGRLPSDQDLLSFEVQKQLGLLWIQSSEGVHYSKSDGATWVDAPRYAADKFFLPTRGALLWLANPSGVISIVDANQPELQRKVASLSPSFSWRVLPDADGNTAWLLNDEGETLQMTASGVRLHTLPNRERLQIFSVAGEANGKSVWYTAAGGKIAHLSATQPVPTMQQTPNGQELLQIRFSEDGTIGWACGQGGLVWRTIDGGKTWQDAYPYRRSMAPAWYASLLLVGLVAGLGHWPKSAQATKGKNCASIADILVRDSPLELQDAKGSDLDRLAAGLSNFLRNPSTGAPLVLAITGAWGTGKSSLMNLMRSRLAMKGFYPVWFNAWHHQQEEHLLAALLENIRSQAIPPLFSRSGIIFRWNLFWERYKRRAWLIALSLFCVGFLTVWLQRVSTKGLDPSKLETLLSVLPAGLALAPLLWGLKLIQAFGIHPSELVLPESAKSGDVRAQTSFRHRFSQEFGEVTRALLPRTMAIFIDDLDRCEPDHMMTVLESINFLSTSGPCFIVLGMEERTVLECLAKKLNWRTDLGSETADEDEIRKARRKHAEHWLEKLIQVRIPVPPLTEDVTQSILGQSSGTRVPQDRIRAAAVKPVLRKVRQIGVALLPLILFVLAIGAGAWLARRSKVVSETKSDVPTWLDKVEFEGSLAGLPLKGKLHDNTKKLPGGGTPVAAKFPAADNPAPGAEPPSEIPPAETDVAAPSRIGQRSVVSGDQDSTTWTWPILVLLLLLVVVWVGLTIQPYENVEDSESFLDEVQAWRSVIVQAHHTPRALKRFVNRLRFYAMLVRNPDKPDDAPNMDERLIVGFGVLEACRHSILCRALRGEPVDFEIRDAELSRAAAHVVATMNESERAQSEEFRRLTAAINFGEEQR